MIIKITQLREPDWPIYKAVRLRALQSDPGVFGSTYVREANFPDAEWQSRLVNPDSGVFVLFDGDAPIGMTGVGMDKKPPGSTQAILWGSWLDPAYRGRGLSREMYRARLDWAARHPACETIIVSHRGSNDRSKAANQKQGFVFTHRTRRVWPDGVEDDQLYYALPIKQTKLLAATDPIPE